MNREQAISAIAEPVTDNDLALLEAALLESRIVVKSNPNHAPAGSPEGGQFTSGDGSGTGHASHGPLKQFMGGPNNKYFQQNLHVSNRFALNRQLRTGKPQVFYDTKGLANSAASPWSFDGQLKAFDKAVKQDVLEKRTTFYRGIRGKVAEKMRAGTQFTDKGFGYFTTEFRLAIQYAGKTGVIVVARMPAGTRGKWGWAGQHEFIIPRNARYMVQLYKDGMLTVKVKS